MVVGTTALALLLGCGTALATHDTRLPPHEHVWSLPTPLGPAWNTTNEMKMASPGIGESVAVFKEPWGDEGAVWGSVQRGWGPFEAPVKLDDAGGPPVVAGDESGGAVAAWYSAGGVLRVVRRSAGEPFGSAAVFPGPEPSSGSAPVVAASDRGGAVVAYQRPESDYRSELAR